MCILGKKNNGLCDKHVAPMFIVWLRSSQSTTLTQSPNCYIVWLATHTSSMYLITYWTVYQPIRLTSTQIIHPYYHTFSISPCNCPLIMGRNNLIGVPTRYGAGRSANRIPAWTKYSAPIQNSSWVHPDSCKMGTGSLSKE